MWGLGFLMAVYRVLGSRGSLTSYKILKYGIVLYTCPRLASQEMSEILTNEHVASQYSSRAFQYSLCPCVCLILLELHLEQDDGGK